MFLLCLALKSDGRDQWLPKDIAKVGLGPKGNCLSVETAAVWVGTCNLSSSPEYDSVPTKLPRVVLPRPSDLYGFNFRLDSKRQ